ncbi:hypothetical protein OAB09_04510 [Pelagibacteraceae bacterium]|nr:hypothetical protein [Pelagibacteraceae bacterium]
MKKLLAIIALGLFLITPSQADDISDFQIEGMSIGDSLLDYLSEEEIKKIEKIYHYKSKKYYQIRIDKNINQYELATIHLKEKDKKYIINNIAGVIEYKKKDKKKCENKMAIIKDFIIENLNLKVNFDEGNLTWDKTGKSKFKRYSFLMPSTNQYNLSVVCQFWDVDTPFSLVLKTTINSEKFSLFLKNEAYK